MTNLRNLAESDLQVTLEDKENGFATDIVLTNLSAESQTVQGQYHRTSVDIDPETGLQIKASKSAITVRTSSVDGKIEKGWKVSVVDINGNTFNGIVAFPPLPDNTLGFTTILVREVEI